MKKPQSVLGWCIATLLLVSCSENSANQTPSPSPVASVTPSTVAPAAPQSFPSPSVSVKPNQASQPTAPGLIQSTNAEERVAQITAGRSDPFNSIVPSAVVVPSSVVSVRTGPQQPIPLPNPVPSVVPPEAPLEADPAPATTARPTRSPQTIAPLSAKVPPLPTLETVPLPNLAPATPDLAYLPGLAPVSPPATSLASAVQVSGVMQYGSTFSAIVKAPDEQSDRYVVPGEFLSNGKVMVKRIEINASGEPVVILEENGLEIVKPVGLPRLAGNF